MSPIRVDDGVIQLLNRSVLCLVSRLPTIFEFTNYAPLYLMRRERIVYNKFKSMAERAGESWVLWNTYLRDCIWGERNICTFEYSEWVFTLPLVIAHSLIVVTFFSLTFLVILSMKTSSWPWTVSHQNQGSQNLDCLDSDGLVIDSQLL